MIDGSTSGFAPISGIAIRVELVGNASNCSAPTGNSRITSGASTKIYCGTSSFTAICSITVNIKLVDMTRDSSTPAGES